MSDVNTKWQPRWQHQLTIITRRQPKWQHKLETGVVILRLLSVVDVSWCCYLCCHLGGFVSWCCHLGYHLVLASEITGSPFYLFIRNFILSTKPPIFCHECAKSLCYSICEVLIRNQCRVVASFWCCSGSGSEEKIWIRLRLRKLGIYPTIYQANSLKSNIS
jgi:hypothetical protein